MKYAFVFLVMICFKFVSAVPYPGCANPTDADFRMVTLTTRATGDLNEPLKMSFDMTDAGTAAEAWPSTRPETSGSASGIHA